MPNDEELAERPVPSHMFARQQSKEKIIKKRLIIVIVVFAVLVAALACVYFLWEAPPELADARMQAQTPADTPMPTLPPTPGPTMSPEEIEEAEEKKIIAEAPAFPDDPKRKKGVYTILLAGIDDTAMLTDTIVVGMLDTENHRMNFVNIPRDTIIYGGVKINSVYYGTVRETDSNEAGAKSLAEQVSNIIGYDVDCYAIIDIGAFIDVVDTIGGVWFDVPVDVEYIDQGNGYCVYQRAGYYHLDGLTAMGVVRYRHAYPTGDLGRIDTQHAFLKAVADQCLSAGKIPQMKAVLDILSSRLQTDLSAANIAWFMRQALQCKSEDIQFMTVPAHGVMWNDVSYAAIDDWQWCQMLNEYFNPFENVTYFPQMLNLIVDYQGTLTNTAYPGMPIW